jgi:hypothetical protein
MPESLMKKCRRHAANLKQQHVSWLGRVLVVELPERYIIGQDFFNDTELIDIKIMCHFKTSVAINPFGFKSTDCLVGAKQVDEHLVVSIERKISKKLFEALSKDNNIMFIIGYIDDVLPETNKHLENQKYLSGHALSKQYTTLDIESLIVLDSIDKKRTDLSWQINIEPFPPAKSLSPGSDHIFIRDYLDSTTLYLTYSLDECVRKTITSLGNYFHRNSLKGTFKKRLSKCLIPSNYPHNWRPYLNILEDNISLIYLFRNNIVHDKLRLDFSDRWLCKKGIGTLSYIYQSQLNNEQTIKYVIAIAQQFLLLDNVLRGYKLDDLREADKDNDETPIIKDLGDLDALMFNGLKISEEEEQLIMKKYLREGA